MTKKVRYNVQLPPQDVYATPCPILYALEIIGGKWKLPILWFLSQEKSVRYNELKRRLRGVSNMMLTKCLRELEDDGLVLRRQYEEVPPRVEYSLAQRGSELLPALNDLYAWGQKQVQTCPTSPPQPFHPHPV